MANLTGQQICSTYGRLLQIDGGQLQDGLGNPITSLGANFSASYATFANSSLTALTASYIDVTGSGVLVNWNGPQLQLTASAGGASVTVNQTPPTTPAQGDLWWDTDDANMYVYYDDGTTQQWVPATSLAVQSVSADNAISASYALTASYVIGGGSSVSSSYALTSSNALTASYFFTSSVTNAATASTFLMTDYITREFIDDTAAAAGGIPLGGIYRTGNVIVVRIS